MQLPRRDVERLRQILEPSAAAADMEASPRAKRALMHRGPFQEALTWLEIHGQAPDVLEHWKGFYEGRVPQEVAPSAAGGPARRATAAATREAAAALRSVSTRRADRGATVPMGG